jgi:hypothetical protein
MTKAATSPVRREMRGSDGKDYVITLNGAGVLVREKGKRQGYSAIPASAIYSVAAKMEALALGRTISRRIR